MRIANGVSLTANGNGCCMAPERKKMDHFCCILRNQVDVICLQVSSDHNRKRHSLSVEGKSYPANAFHLFVNVLLAFWLFLLASSYFLFSRNVNNFGGCSGKNAHKVSSSDRPSSNASTESDATANDAFSCSESSGHCQRISSNKCCSEVCTNCDAYYEISDLDKASYMHSLLDLEDEDSEWLSDSMPCRRSSEDPSTPFCYKGDAYCEISDFKQGSYLHSLLSLDDEDSEWVSDSKSCGCSFENPSTPVSYKCNSYFEISALEKANYMHSLLSLEDEEDSEWFSDSKSFGRSSEEPSTPLSYKCDAYYAISDLDKASYLRSLLSLEDDEDSEWLSDSKHFGGSSEFPSTPLSYKFDAASEISDLDEASYLRSLLSLEDEDSEWLADSKHFVDSSENPSTPLSCKFEAYSEISALDKASYMHSLISLEDEDSEWLSDSKPFGCSSENLSTSLGYKFDVVSEISDFDKASYLHSILSLEDVDSEWLSNLKFFGVSSESISTPLSYKFDAPDISALDKASYMHSLISLEDEDSKWLSDSKSFGCSCENPSTPKSYNCDAFSEISYLDKASYSRSLLSIEDEISDLDKDSYLHSLLSLEDEDPDWFSDSNSYGCSSNNSTPLSYKCDGYYDISDLDKSCYLNSLLSLEDEDSEWLSDSTSRVIGFLSSVSTSSSFTGVQRGNPEDNISAEHLLKTAYVEEELSDDEPLFWPFEGKHNWNSEEPWSSFFNSPRRRFLSDSRSMSARIKECNKEKGDGALSSVNYETSMLSMWAKSSGLECEDLDSTMDLLGKEYFALGREIPIETLMGLKEFDGHEGLGSEFNYVFCWSWTNLQ
ncbi:hypothetical protein VNO78_14323 [Psophocarpus tetragonolobus]|uniref:Uncharacterized protein n=1 Tax=Psophocarpus tetragonolobus TaxID=3891 RepID=A0AAN9SRB1_PSOTE